MATAVHGAHRPSSSPSNKPLPDGRCKYKNLGLGPDPPTCGCQRFWESEKLNVCVCEHHACYHNQLSSPPSTALPSIPPPHTQTLHHTCPDSFQQDVEPSPTLNGSQIIGLEGVFEDARATMGLRRHVEVSSPGSLRAQNNATSDPSTSELPPIPSICLRSADKREHAIKNKTGLGLTVDGSRPPSSMGTMNVYPMDIFCRMHSSYPDLPSTRRSSTTEEDPPDISPDPAFTRAAMRIGVVEATRTSAMTSASGPAQKPLVQSISDMNTPVIAESETKRLDLMTKERKELAEALSRMRRIQTELASQTTNSPDTAITSLDGQSPPHMEALRPPPSTLQQLVSCLTALHGRLSTTLSLPTSIDSLIGRVEALERASFDQVSPVDYKEKSELVDARLLDVEHKLDDHDRRMGALEEDANASLNGVESFKGGRSILPNHHNDNAFVGSEWSSRLKDVEEYLDCFKTSVPPSLEYPWDIEVVFIPWGRELKGIWMPAEEIDRPRSSAATQMSEDGRETQHTSMELANTTAMGLTMWSDGPALHWPIGGDGYLSPKACGPKNVVYHRLKSRGLVRQITLTDQESVNVHQALSQAFGQIETKFGGSQTEKDRLRKRVLASDNTPFLGLRAPFIPLRKVSRSSRLRFLSLPEMVTPSLWTASFLASSVLMRLPGGGKRLYITQADAYLQPCASSCTSWTWPKLRELPRIIPLDEEQADAQIESYVAEADAREPCWAHYPDLDPPPSSYSSFHSDISAEPQPTMKSILQPTTTVTDDSNQSHQAQALEQAIPVFEPITPTSETPNPIKPPPAHPGRRRHRTLSAETSDATPSIITTTAEAKAKRRVRSFELSKNPLFIDKLPSFVPSPSSSLSKISKNRTTKRRRITRSRSGSARIGDGAESDDLIEREIAYLESGDMRALPGVGGWEMISPSTGAFSVASGYRSLEGVTGRTKASQGVHAAGGTAGGSSSGPRGVTPFAYPTPYSEMFVNATSASHGESAVVGADEGDDEEGEPWEGVTEEIAQDGLDPEDDEEEEEEDVLGNELDDEVSMLADEGDYDEV